MRGLARAHAGGGPMDRATVASAGFYRENITMSTSIMEDKESTSVLRVIIGLVTFLTFGAFAAMYFFTGETTDTHMNKTEAKSSVPAPNATPHPVDLL